MIKPGVRCEDVDRQVLQIIKDDPASRLQQFVHQEEGGAIDGPVLGTVDKAEVIAWLTPIVVGMRLNLFFQKPGVACFFPVYVNMG